MKKRNILNLVLVVLVFVTLGCKKDKEKSYKISINKTDQIGAKATYTITKGDGDLSPTEYGLVYSKSSSPTVNDAKVTISGDSESKTLKGLDLSTKYYVRPFVTDKNGTTYYDQEEFTTYCLDVDSIAPRSATVGTTITVYGRGFATLASDMAVLNYEGVTPDEKVITPMSISNTQMTYNISPSFVVGREYIIGVARYNTNCNYAYSTYLDGHIDDDLLHLLITN